MPTIITAHIANVSHTSAAVHDMFIDMPISAIIASCAIDADIPRAMWTR